MKISEFLKDVAQRANLELTQDAKNGEKLSAHLLRTFNLYNKDLNARKNWPWNEKTTHFQTVPNYTDGTVTVTNGSRTVTGNSTSFTSAMVDRVLKLNREIEQYEILSFDSATQVTLKTPYIGASASGQGYLIWKKYYDLEPDIPYLGRAYLWTWPNKTIAIPPKELNDTFRNAWNSGNPQAFAWGGINRAVSTYQAGTVSATLDSNILTGSGTTFIDNVFAGTKITVGAETYNVQTVDSNTQCTLVQSANATVSGSAYTAKTSNRSRIILSATPNPAVNLYCTYFKRTYDYKNLNDEPEIWTGHEHLISNVMYGYTLEKLTDNKSFSWLTVYEAGVNNSWNELKTQDPIDRVTQTRKTVSVPLGY